MDEMPDENTGAKPEKELTGKDRGRANLKPPWPKGFNPNPNNIGKLGALHLKTRLERMARCQLPTKANAKLRRMFPDYLSPEEENAGVEAKLRKNHYDMAMGQLLMAADRGEEWAIKIMLDRGLGKVTEKVDVTSDGQSLAAMTKQELAALIVKRMKEAKKAE